MKRIRLYLYWRQRKKGTQTCDWIRGCGYYFSTGLIFYNPIGKLEEVEMKSGKTGIFKLIDYELYRDPDDMIKESRWMFIGYKDTKPVNDCGFREWIKLYLTP